MNKVKNYTPAEIAEYEKSRTIHPKILYAQQTGMAASRAEVRREQRLREQRAEQEIETGMLHGQDEQEK